MVSGAQAADLGVKKPSPVEYVKVCNTYGAGFFYIPGSNTCLKIGGRVRAEYQYFSFNHQGYNAATTGGFRSQGHIQLDARTATEYGTLRTFVRLLMNSRTGSAVSGSQQRYGTSTVAQGADFFGKAQTNLDLIAFIQFAGFTVGRTGSFFDFYTGEISWIGTGGNGINTVSSATNLFAYTYSFGQGFSATLSVEDGTLRRQLILAGRESIGGNLTAPVIGTNSSYYGGTQTPDIVGNVRYESGWGSAQLSAALHEVITTRVATNATAAQLAVVGGLANAGATGRDYGFAVQGGVKINLPFLAAGDILWLQAAYGQGTASYTFGGGFNGTGSAGAGVIDAYNASVIADGYAYTSGPAGARTSKVDLSESFNIFAGLQHYWTPTIRQAVYGSYGQINYGKGGVPFVNALNLGGITEFRQIQVGSQLVWSPVKDLDIGVEAQYVRNENNNRGTNYGVGAAAVLPLNVKRTSDGVQARIRVQRDF